MAGGIEGQLALLIDRKVAYGDLPSWMSNARAVRRPRPSQAARDVEHALFAVLAPEQRRPFVGRQELSKGFAATLLAQNYEPRVIVMTGLEGVGRRSYLERVSQDVLDLPIGPQIWLGQNAGLEDVFARLLGEVADITDRAELARNLAAFQTLDDSERAAEIARQFGTLAKGRTVPVLVDSGSLMERDSGEYQASWLAVFESFMRLYPNEYLGIIQRRVPHVRDLPFGHKFLVQRVPPLADLDVRVLIGQLLRRTAVPHSAADVDELAEFTSGYPPSAYFGDSSSFGGDSGGLRGGSLM